MLTGVPVTECDDPVELMSSCRGPSEEVQTAAQCLAPLGTRVSLPQLMSTQWVRVQTDKELQHTTETNTHTQHRAGHYAPPPGYDGARDRYLECVCAHHYS